MKRDKDAYEKGLSLGYRVGYQAGQIEVLNRIWAALKDTELLLEIGKVLKKDEPKTLAEKQIELILKKAEEEGKL